MTFSIKIAGAAFTNIVDKTVPYLSKSAGFWLFGGDQAASIKNLAPNPLVANASVVGTGAPIYSPGFMQMSVAGPNASAIDSGLTLAPTHPFTYVVVGELIGGANYLVRSLAGTWHSGIAGSDIVQGYPPATMPSAAFSGGSVLAAPASALVSGGIGFAASTSSAAGRALYTHDGVAMQVTTGTPQAAPLSNTFRVGPFGGRGSTSTETARYCAAMVFPEVLTQAQLLEIRDYLKFKLAKRGVNMQ